MKKVALLLAGAFILVHQGIAQSGDDIVSIPDTAFLYALIDEGVDTNEDSLISYNEAESVDILFIWSSGITDMTGIEAFVMLTDLIVDENNIGKLNLSTLSELLFLSCSGNPIDSLDLSNNPNLIGLWVDRCNLTTLDLSSNPGLQYLKADRCKLTNVDLSNNPALEVLFIYSNSLTNLDLSANVNLEIMWCASNNLGSLDVSKNRRLKELYCQNLPIDTLDVSMNDSLEILACGWSLTGLILPDTSALRELMCFQNFLDSVDVSGCPNLVDFRCFDNNITSLDLTHNPLLEILSCENNQLSSLDVSNNTELNALWCDDNQLNTLDLSQNGKIGSIPWQWDHLSLENMPSLTEVCVWDSFPGDATVTYDGSPNICFDSIACDGVCTYPIGIEGFDESALMIYPNPTSDILTIESVHPGPHSIELYSINGQKVYAASFTGTLQQIDLSFFRKGIYFLTIRNEKLVTTRKIVKL